MAPNPTIETGQNFANLIELVYQVALGRPVEPEVLVARVAALKAGTPFANMFVEIAKSEEANQYARTVARQRKCHSSSAPTDLIALTYQAVLGRPVENDAVVARADAIVSGTPFADMFVEIATSEEALRHQQKIAHLIEEYGDRPTEILHSEGNGTELLGAIVVAAYKHFLQRTPTRSEIDLWLNRIRGGLSVERLFHNIANSEEANNLPRGPRLGSTETDGEFLIHSGALLYGRGLLPQEVTYWQGVIREDPSKREYFLFDRINDYLRATRASDRPDELHDASSCWIMGTTRVLAKKNWDERQKQLAARPEGLCSAKRSVVSRETAFQHSGSFKISMIASLYKGRKFVRQFLDNITSQSLFQSSELIIIDANSPENEHEIIEEYKSRFPNIVYRRFDYCIGIYEAWNVSIEMARGRYLTTTNVDDLRRYDSIELQSALLDENDEVDVVYQDFYYSLDPFLTFEEIAAYGFKSELPIVTPHNLLAFNSPHNAPMWRANLHDELGKFDTRYRSVGDWEFWIRCLLGGKRFRKINSPHVSYYQNPGGVSTRPDTRGIEEGRDVLRRYSAKLMSPALLQSRQDFWVSLGIHSANETMPDDLSYYDLAQSALLSLGASRPVTRAASDAIGAEFYPSGASVP